MNVREATVDTGRLHDKLSVLCVVLGCMPHPCVTFDQDGGRLEPTVPTYHEWWEGVTPRLSTALGVRGSGAP